jgi:hypothetical protein
MLRYADLTVPHGFWEIIKEGQHSQDQMRHVLQRLGKKALEAFGIHFDYLVADLAMQVKSSGQKMSDDTLDLLAGWVVSQGEEHFTKVFDDPSLFPKVSEADYSLKENFYGLAGWVYEERFHEPFPDDGETIWDKSDEPVSDD